MDEKGSSRLHPSAADHCDLPTLVDFENRRHRSRAHRNELVVEIPVALLDIFERETIVPLTRPRTHSNPAVLRIRPRDPSPKPGLLSVITRGS